MYRVLREHVNIRNALMFLTLVLAMSGGAYAAGKYVITSTKQISPKVLVALKGKSGSNGKAGANGQNGAPGKDGAAGEKGAPGANGKDGTSVTSATLGVGNTHCKEGGSEFTAAEAKNTYTCNGKEGAPWTAGGVLPNGKSEYGQWSYYDAKASEGEKAIAVSFGLPLKTAPAAHFIGTKEELAGEPKEAAAIKEGKCSGSVEKPEAASGQLCVFAKSMFGAGVPTFIDAQTGANSSEAAGTDGTLIHFTAEPLGGPGGITVAVGSWSVTGDE